MKKLFCLVLATILFTFITGCTEQDDSSSQSNSSNSQSSQSYSSNIQSSSNSSSILNSQSNKTSKPISSNKTKPQESISNKPIVSTLEEPSPQAPVVTPPATPEVVSPVTPEVTPERQANGTLYTSTMYNIDIDKYNNVYSKEIDKDAAQFALYTDGLIKNFTITKVSMDFDTLKYKDEEQLFSFDTFDTDSVVVIRTFFADIAAHLKVTYTTDTGTIVRYLKQSGKDDSILLLEE